MFVTIRKVALLLYQRLGPQEETAKAAPVDANDQTATSMSQLLLSALVLRIYKMHIRLSLACCNDNPWIKMPAASHDHINDSCLILTCTTCVEFHTPFASLSIVCQFNALLVPVAYRRPYPGPALLLCISHAWSAKSSHFLMTCDLQVV